MPKEKTTESSRKVRGTDSVCPIKLRRVLDHRNLTQKELETMTRLRRNTLSKIQRGEAVRVSTLERLYSGLGLKPGSLRPDSEFDEQEQAHNLKPPQNWVIERVLGPWQKAPNELSYRITKMMHLLVPRKVARGKFYDLLHINEHLRKELRNQLIRHSSVCEQVKPHPNIASNLIVIPLEFESGWWILDSWVEGTSLEEWVRTGRAIDQSTVRRIGHAVLEGLNHLHAAKIIFRELAPDKIWIGTEQADSDTSDVLLTDFELAKLASGEPSVSGWWKPGYFRAPEVSDKGDAFPASDLYSFAKVIMWLMHGGKEVPAKQANLADLPSGVAECVKACASIRRSERPSDVQQVLATWKAWK